MYEILLAVYIRGKTKHFKNKKEDFIVKNPLMATSVIMSFLNLCNFTACPYLVNYFSVRGTTIKPMNFKCTYTYPTTTTDRRIF